MQQRRWLSGYVVLQPAVNGVDQFDVIWAEKTFVYCEVYLVEQTMLREERISVITGCVDLMGFTAIVVVGKSEFCCTHFVQCRELASKMLKLRDTGI